MGPAAALATEGTRTIQIGEGRYTAFTGHVMIWSDKVAAIDTHSNSPGLGRLGVYFRKQAEGRVIFRPLYNQGTAEQLKDLDGIRGVDLAIHDSHKITQARKRGMLKSLILSRKFPSISVSAGMSRKQPKDSYIEPEVEDELLELADSAEQYFDRLIVRGLSKTKKTKPGRRNRSASTCSPSACTSPSRWTATRTTPASPNATSPSPDWQRPAKN